MVSGVVIKLQRVSPHGFRCGYQAAERFPHGFFDLTPQIYLVSCIHFVLADGGAPLLAGL
jgi:hypothetical protein